jgi:hypothetical protein
MKPLPEASSRLMWRIQNSMKPLSRALFGNPTEPERSFTEQQNEQRVKPLFVSSNRGEPLAQVQDLRCAIHEVHN